MPPGARLTAHVREAGAATRARLDANLPAIQRLARVEQVSHEAAPAGGAAQLVVGEATFVLPLEGVIDIAAERARLEKSIAAAAREAGGIAGRLGNADFVAKAKPEVVEDNRERLAALEAEVERLRAALARLG